MAVIQVKNLDKLSSLFREAATLTGRGLKEVVRLESTLILKSAIQRTFGDEATSTASINRRYTPIWAGGLKKAIPASALAMAGLGLPTDGNRIFIVRENMPLRFAQYLAHERKYRLSLIGQSKATWVAAASQLRLPVTAPSFAQRASLSQGVRRNVTATSRGEADRFEIKITNAFKTVPVAKVRMFYAIQSSMKARERFLKRAVAEGIDSKVFKKLERKYGRLIRTETKS